jgi:protein-disulfide isomerase
MALATEAAWCAQDQGRFFDYQHALYEALGQIPYNQSTLNALAAQIGLDEAAFAECLSSRTHQADVEAARRAAVNTRGINATPTFFINDQRVEGNQPYDVFVTIIEQELAAAQ